MNLFLHRRPAQTQFSHIFSFSSRMVFLIRSELASLLVLLTGYIYIYIYIFFFLFSLNLKGYILYL